jgi:Tfp pilus assembly protein PilN
LTKINLLPPERIKAKRAPRAPSERSWLWLVIAAPLVVLVLMLLWWFSMNADYNRKQESLDQAKKELADLQAKNASLQQYKTRKDQIAQIEQTVVKALSGRVYWARILNNVAIMCPGDVWLNDLNGTSEGGAGTVVFDGYVTQCPNRMLGGFFPGMNDYHPDYKPVARWLERMAQIEQFQRVWLTAAEPTFLGTVPQAAEGQPAVDMGSFVTSAEGSWVVKFSSTATLNMKTAALGTPTTTSSSSSGTATPGGGG